MGKACNHLVQNFLSYCWLYKNMQININRYTILPVVLYGCETSSGTFREECRLREFKKE